MKALNLFPLFAAGFLLMSCASSLEDRIRENQAEFDSLPPVQKAQVVQGNIAVGMTPATVKMVWGEPATVVTGQLNGKPSERWLYSTSGGSGFSFGVGAGVGTARSSSAYGLGTGVSFPIDYVPANTSYVLFVNGKVVSWEGSGN